MLLKDTKITVNHKGKHLIEAGLQFYRIIAMASGQYSGRHGARGDVSVLHLDPKTAEGDYELPLV